MSSRISVGRPGRGSVNTSAKKPLGGAALLSGTARYPMDRNCPVCFGIGWVCENHPDRAWSDELGCMCGAGMPCECNRADEPNITLVIIEEGSRS